MPSGIWLSGSTLRYVAKVALVLDELSQLQGTLQALRESRRERRG